MFAEDQRVLIAETDPGLRRDLSAGLREGGILSDRVRNADHLLRSLVENHYVAVVLDTGLSGGTTEEILQVIRGLPPSRRPIVLVVFEGETPRELDAETVQILVRKPYGVKELTAVIRGCLEFQRRMISLGAGGMEEQAPKNV